MIGLEPRTRRDSRRESARRRDLRVESLEGRLLLAVVLNTDDDGIGSLRQAIIDTNADPSDNTITFSLGGAGLQTILVGSTTGLPLPALTSPVTIDGPSPATGAPPTVELRAFPGLGASANGLVINGGNSTINDLIITGFGGHGVLIEGPGGNTLRGLYIGINEDASSTTGNGGDGVFISNSPNNVIGGSAVAARNLIGGNVGNGVHIAGPNSLENRVENNVIGTNTAESSNLPNGGAGVRINGASRNTIGGTTTGTPNTIAFNGMAGVVVVAGNENAIRRNSMFQNAGLGIELEPGANEDIPAPVLTLVTTSGANTRVQGNLTGAQAGTVYTLEFFSNTELGPPAGTAEGRTFLSAHTVTTNGDGAATIDQLIAAITLGRYITVTATDPNGNTSEFSNPEVNSARSADLRLSGNVSPNPVARSGYLNYTFTLVNDGPDEADATFATTLPSSLNFVQASSTLGVLSRSGNQITVQFDPLDVGASSTITIQVVPLTSGTINLTAIATAPEDTTNANNTVTLTTQAVAGINLDVVGSALPSSVRLGEEVAFRFTVTNRGEAISTDTRLREQLPENLEYVSVWTSQGNVTFDPSTGLIDAPLGSLAPNASAVVTVVVRPKTEGVLYNGILATGVDPEVDERNNFGVASVQVLPPLPPVPPTTTPPTVIRLNRFGRGTQPTSLSLGFSQQLEVISAENLSNYQLRDAGRDGRFGTADDVNVPIRQVMYDPTNVAVTLVTGHPISLRSPLQITVHGSTPTGVRNLDGILLDGTGTGQPGSNFVRTFVGTGPGELTAAGIARRPGVRRLF